MRLARYFATFAAGTTLLVLLTLVVLVVAVTLVESAGDLTDAQAGTAAAFWLALYSSIQQRSSCFDFIIHVGTIIS